MIDDDKIIKAASELCDYGSIHDSEYRIEGFKNVLNGCKKSS